MFDKFYRVPRTVGVIGMGLGPTICRRIVEAHQGAIAAVNRDDGGTIVTITLPLVARRAPG
ncbi:MAG: ATP-binding protein [Chloroflexi bacterium]|nr:ATP-binding protein [Chloroflexota bacterium]